jgi:DUF1009 family protein
MSAAHSTSESTMNPLPRLGVIAGAGELPLMLRNICREQGRPIFVIAIQNATDPAAVADIPHVWMQMGEIAHALEVMKEANVEEVVMAGRLPRPSITSLKPSLTTTRMLARLGAAFFSGDDALLSTITRIFEEENIRVVGTDEILHELLTPAGPLTRLLPDRHAQADIRVGVEAAHTLGALDIGQGVIVQNGRVLAVEAAEGTDEMLRRTAQYIDETSKGGVLVKAKKPSQERRVDLPAIGIRTIELAAEIGLAGIALEADGTLVIDRRAVVDAANKAGIFIIGFSREENA